MQSHSSTYHAPVSLYKTFLVAGVFVVWTLCVLPFGWAAVLVAKFLALWGLQPLFLQEAARRFVAFYGRGLLFFQRLWMPVYTKNAHKVQDAGPCVMVVNHQSFLDVFLLASQKESNLCLVSKSWPYKVLFYYAPVMRLAGYIDAEALEPEEVERLCLLRLKEGATVVFFPEGTRSKDGKLQKFHVGAFWLAQKAGVPVVPMVIKNAWYMFPKGAKRLAPQPIYIELLEPVQPQDFYGGDLPHRAMLRHVRSLFISHL